MFQVCFLLLAQQLTSVAVYFCWYSNFLVMFHDDSVDHDGDELDVDQNYDHYDDQEEEDDVPMSKSYDPGALLAITLTTITTATFNVMLGGSLAHQYFHRQTNLCWVIVRSINFSFSFWFIFLHMVLAL